MQREVVVRQASGTHLRVVKRIFEVAARLEAEVRLRSAVHTASVRSMLDLMQLAARAGDRVVLTARGRDAERALTEVAAILAAEDWDAEVGDG